MPLVALGVIGAVGAIGGAAISANAAGNAANAQVGAANSAAQLQHQDAQAALQFQQQQFNTQQANMAPWLQAGGGALSQLSNLLGVTPNTSIGGTPGTTPTSAGPGTINLTRGANGVYSAGNSPRMPLSALRNGGPRMGGEFPVAPLRGGSENGIVPTGPGQNIAPGTAVTPNGPGTPSFGSLLQGYDKQFTAPTDVTEQNDPGYKFRLQQGLDALQNSAAARGGLLSGGTAKSINDYAQNSASAEYGNVYNRALGEYQQGYNIFENNQANKFNRLAALSGVGQTAASQLGQGGQAASNNVSNILLGSGQQIGQSLNNAGAARASGYVGSGNAIGGAVSGIGSNMTQLLLLKNLLGSGSNLGSLSSITNNDGSLPFINP